MDFRLLLEFAFGLILIFLILELKLPPARKTPIKTKRLLFFDFVKGLAIIAVIGMHVADHYTNNYINTLKLITSFAVPLFIICSGYLLSLRYRIKIDLKKYYSRFFFRIVLIYLLFTLFQYFLTYIRSGAFNVIGFFLDLILGYGNYYFIPLIIQFYILFPILSKFQKFFKNFYLISAIFAFSLFFLYLDLKLRALAWNSNRVSLCFFGGYLLYFIIGMYLPKLDLSELSSSKTTKFFVWFISSSIILSLLYSKLILTYFYPIFIFLFFRIFYNYFSTSLMASKIFNLFGEFGKNSLVIYLIHTNILVYFINFKYSKMTFFNAELNWIIRYILFVTVVLLLSYICSRIFMYLYNRILEYTKIRESKKKN